MGRKARHSARTGDGGAEVRLRNKQLKEAEKAQKVAELTFYDDPSENESDSEQVESDDDELAGEEVLELGDDEDEDEGEEDDDDDDMYDADGERKKAMQMEGKWGKNRKTFYSADTAEYELESDEDIAKDEEEAALELQRKQAEMMDDEDFGIDAPEADGEEEEEEEEGNEAAPVDDEELVGEQLADIAMLADNGAGGAETVEQVHKDFSKMSKKDKLQIVNQSAPELLGLMSELESTTKELEEVVTPAVLKLRPVRRKSRQLQMGLRYLMTRQNLLLNYSANISFYLLLRAEGKSVSDHPVLMHLLLLKKQLSKLQSIDEVLSDQLQDLLTKELPAEREPKADDGLDKFFAKSDRKRSADGEKVSSKKSKKQKKAADVSAEELAEAERFYEQTARDQAEVKKAKKEFYTHETPVALASSDEDSDMEGEAGKRGASYQIMKNKGLKAHKSKLNRNPRVKKRLQYRKAVIRRKGQVRDVRVGEAGKYGGETTGIKSNLSRSRKIRN
ncbi:Something about silencing protein 10 [Phytophthora pseudosyringae]|uniref:Something about silencing protein 10 n=1 Tax=Phytophthora pseudosyringae TaxID=221518 RepID=A0A8T1VGV0_9STRA|nr:Something about silencing protein 10 [Phytophthora pseudosyringae]